MHDIPEVHEAQSNASSYRSRDLAVSQIDLGAFDLTGIEFDHSLVLMYGCLLGGKLLLGDQGNAGRFSGCQMASMGAGRSTFVRGGSAAGVWAARQHGLRSAWRGRDSVAGRRFPFFRSEEQR